MLVVVFFAVVFREIDDVRFGTNKPKLVWEFQWTANVFYYTTAHTLGHNWCLIYYHRDTILTFISLKHTYNTHTYLLSNAYLLDCAESIFRTNNWGGSRCCALAGGTLPERAERETLRKWGEKKRILCVMRSGASDWLIRWTACCTLLVQVSCALHA